MDWAAAEVAAAGDDVAAEVVQCVGNDAEAVLAAQLHRTDLDPDLEQDLDQDPDRLGQLHGVLCSGSAAGAAVAARGADLGAAATMELSAAAAAGGQAGGPAGGELPILFLHGIGVGLAPYVGFLDR